MGSLLRLRRGCVKHATWVANSNPSACGIGTTISPISLKRTQSITRCAVYYSVASCKLILHFTPKASLVLQCWAVRPMSLIHQRSDFALGFHCSVQAGENFVLGDSSNYRYSASQVIYAWPLTSPWSRRVCAAPFLLFVSSNSSSKM